MKYFLGRRRVITMQTFEKHLWTTEEIRTLKILRFELELTYDEISVE